MPAWLGEEPAQGVSSNRLPRPTRRRDELLPVSARVGNANMTPCSSSRSQERKLDGKKIMPQPSRAKLLSAKSNQTESLRPDSPTGRPRREVIFPRRYSSETAFYDAG